MKRSKHNLSNYKLLSCDMGELVPIGLTEVLPGDTIQQSTSLLVRLSPLLAPVMHPVHARVHHWFVPHRIIWEDWEKFITGGPDGFDASVFPTITMDPVSTLVGALGDYLGVPPDNDGLEVSALPFRAYSLIFNEWYRDQDLIDPLALSITSGPDATTNVIMQNIAWEKDYFTASRPWTQKGPDVVLPLGDDAPIIGIAAASNQTYPDDGADRFDTQGPVPLGDDWANPAANFLFRGATAAGPQPSIFADLTEASAASINDIRLAFALQRYEEARARYGSRYTEYLRYLGVKSSDARLQRPEYLGGGKQTIQFSEVLQTATDQIEPQTDFVGTLRGHGISALRSRKYRRFFEEHGYIVSCLSVRPKTMYVQGINRTWNRRTKEDFWQKELQHIGQQEIQNQEIFAGSLDGKGVFGYQDRYDEYRRIWSSIGGEFRTTELDFWHMARIFQSDPVLNESFVRSDPTKRIHATATNDVLWIMARHSIQARRMVTKMGKSYIF